MTKTLILMSCCACLLSGCIVERVSPPIQGTVVDAVTGAPVESAIVTINYAPSGYFQDPSIHQDTDQQGRYFFEARDSLFTLPPFPVSVLAEVSLQVKADGYSTYDTLPYTWRSGSNPREKIPAEPNKPAMYFDGKVINFDPIMLVPAEATKQ